MSIELLKCLLCASEKAANIARSCRNESALFELLVEEKTGSDKNAKFVQDFKTLADVLIQETVRHDVSQLFPALERNILGEESNKFTNTLGQTVCVGVQKTEQETRELLSQVLDNNQEAAAILARHVHSTVNFDDLNDKLPETALEDVSIEDVGVWIDPIDGTSQYIKGGWDEVAQHYPPSRGLKVVTVLIGAFNMKTGEPIMGVVNQPFISEGSDIGKISYGYGSVSGLPNHEEIKYEKPRVLIGSSESQELVSALSEQFEVLKAGGAGHKLLMVAQGYADIYINTGPSTFRWDTCAPHAMLRALGGGVRDGHGQEIVYNVDQSNAANKGGIFAFREEKYFDAVSKILKKLKENMTDMRT